MSSIRYFNQSAPFWDFIAQVEANGFQHPFADSHGDQDRHLGADNDETPNHTACGRGGWGGRGRGHGRHHHHHHGPPMPAPPGEGEDGEAPDPPMCPPPPPMGVPPPPCDERGMPLPPPPGFAPRHGPHGHGPWGRRGRCGPGRGRGGFMGDPFNLRNISEFIQAQMSGGNNGNRESEDHVPPVDVFDTENAFVVHVSLPGAKKEDVAVSWDAEKSELVITGVIYRPGDEDFLKTLALDERQVGAFERKIRLGSLAQPAKVDDDAITAKLEDGVLRLEIPKEDKDYVEVKKVDVE